jgi:hypothetical protein
MDEKANAEMREWKKMTNKFTDELAKFQMVCYYCADIMDGSTINEICKINSDKKFNQVKCTHMLTLVDGFTEEKPKSKFQSTGRHYFGIAKTDLFSGKDIITELRAMNEKYPKDNPLLKSLLMHIKKNMSKLIRQCNAKLIDFEKVLSAYDPEKTGNKTINRQNKRD